MTTATAERTWSTPAVAATIGLTDHRMWRMLGRLHTPDRARPGPGRRVRLTDGDVVTLAAWALLTGGGDEAIRPACWACCAAVAAAVRRQGPGPYVVVQPGGGAVFHDPANAVAAAMAARGGCQLVNVSYLWDDLL